MAEQHIQAMLHNVKEGNEDLTTVISTVETDKPKHMMEKSGDYIALIFYPQKLTKQNNQNNFFNSDSGVRERIRVGQVFQLVDPFSFLPRYMTILVHPGTNIGLHIRQESGEEIIQKFNVEYWQRILENPLNRYISHAFDVIKPDPNLLDDLAEPGYRNFTEEDALKLIGNHFAEKWVNRALLGENRATVIKEAEGMKARIKAQEQARTA